ncbi:adhesion protein [Cutibacterium acnes JCM 18916]|nr:adhesion protein [Cutibacterium acnes JCM 18916]
MVLGYLISLLLTEQDTELCPPELVMSPIFFLWLGGLPDCGSEPPSTATI